MEKVQCGGILLLFDAAAALLGRATLGIVKIHRRRRRRSRRRGSKRQNNALVFSFLYRYYFYLLLLLLLLPTSPLPQWSERREG